jgi:hypothetical protein
MDEKGKKYWQGQLESVRHMLDTDPSLLVFCVRDWRLTSDSGLDDLAWAMYKGGYVPRQEASNLFEMLEDAVANLPEGE